MKDVYQMLQQAGVNVLKAIPGNAMEVGDAVPLAASVIMAGIDSKTGIPHVLPVSTVYGLQPEVDRKIRIAANEYGERVNAILMEWAAEKGKKESE